MVDLSVSGAVDRTELSLADLQLERAGVCEIVAYTPPAVSKLREWAKSPTVRGGVQLSSKPDVATLGLILRIYGSTKSNFDTNLAEYLAAFDQDDYTVAVALAGTTTTWSCNDAEWAPVDDDVNKFELMAAPLRQTIRFAIPCQPDPIAGVL